MQSISRRLGASVCLLAGACWLIYAVIVRQFSPSYFHPTAAIDYLAVAVYSGGLLLLALALAGLHACQAASAEWDEQLGFWTACVGALLAGIGDFGEDWLRMEVLAGLLYFPGLLLLLVGLVLFGIGTVRAGVVPKWAGALLLLSPIVAAPLGGLFSRWTGTVLFGLIWVTLGFALWFDYSSSHA